MPNCLKKVNKRIFFSFDKISVFNNLVRRSIQATYFETELVTQIRNDPERFNFINERTPMGRWGYLPELEGALTFLVSPASDFITGRTIYVDGGWTIW
jgi:NAD(P)-dependent dehydrogenase (short-subunit alcohol dehydrogenase family)